MEASEGQRSRVIGIEIVLNLVQLVHVQLCPIVAGARKGLQLRLVEHAISVRIKSLEDCL